MRPATRGSYRGVCAAALLLLFSPAARAPEAVLQVKGMPLTDEGYSSLLDENPELREDLERLNSLLDKDQELERNFLAYEDSLKANPELAELEGALFEALDSDSVLAGWLANFEERAAREPGAAVGLAAMDSILAADPGLAEKVRAVESAAAEDPELLDNYGRQMAYLGSRPREAQDFFSDEDGPYYPGSDQEIVEYVYYLETHPKLFEAYRELYRYLGAARQALRMNVYRGWRWYSGRGALWRAHWRYRVRAAGSPETHRLIWERRTYMGRRPPLARFVWMHHLAAAERPAARRLIWKHRAFVARHPKYSGTVARHRALTRNREPQD